MSVPITSEHYQGWAPEGWRARAVWQLNWFAVFFCTPIIVALVYQGSSRAPAFGVLMLFLIVGALQKQRFPRLRAVVMVLFFSSASLINLHDAGFKAPISVLGISIAAAVVGILWGRRGLIIVLLIITVVIVLTGFNAYVFKIGAPLQADQFLFEDTPANFARQGFVSVLQIGALAGFMSLVTRRQQNVLHLLEKENRERIKAERAFQEAQKAQLVSQVTSGLAHNFGNALTVITTWTELLERNPDNKSYQERAVKDMSEAARQATGVARQVMALGRNYVRQKDVFDPAEILNTQVPLLISLLPSNVRLDVDVISSAPVSLDKSELQQGLFNLVLNANDAIEGDGTVRITLQVVGSEVLLKVEDDGCGMSQEVSERAFEPFFTTKQDGMGLGLTSIKQTVDEAGGRLELESVEGDGSAFSLYFPVHVKTEQLESEPDIERIGQNLHGRVLVADDDEKVRAAMLTGLRETSLELLEANDFPSAKRVVADTDDLDMLVTDAVMPGGTATDLISDFEKKFPGRPILVCSGYIKEDLLASHLKAGEFSYLQKPFSPSTLQQRVFELMSATRSNEQEPDSQENS